MISVLISTYNQEKYISQTLESILSQKCDTQFEILVGDDCSTDNNRKIIDCYVEKYPSIVRAIYTKKNVGASKNLVNMLQYARGEYIATIDGDDMWIDNLKLQKQLDAIRMNSQIGMVVARAKCWDENNMCFTGTTGTDIVNDFTELIMSDSDIASPTQFFKKTELLKCVEQSSWFIENNYFFDSVISYWFAYYSRIYFIPEDLAMYRVLEESGCHSKDKELAKKYEKRYFLIKLRFLIENKISIDITYNYISHQWDKVYDWAWWQACIHMRNSLSFKCGNVVVQPLKKIKSLLYSILHGGGGVNGCSRLQYVI